MEQTCLRACCGMAPVSECMQGCGAVGVGTGEQSLDGEGIPAQLGPLFLVRSLHGHRCSPGPFLRDL
jgi:hypothetical protein